MRKYFLVSLFALFGIAAVADACPQAIRRGVRVERVVQPRRVVERQVVRERVVHQPIVERQVVREYYSAPVVERQVECQSGCVQEFRRVERIRSGY